MDNQLALLTLFGSIIALLFVASRAQKVLRFPEGNETMKKISGSIHKGAMAYLRRQYKILIGFFAVMFVILFVMAALDLLTWFVPFAFVTGGFFSGLSGFVGMQIATRANARTAAACQKSLNKGLNVAFSAGSVMGFTVVGLGLLDISIWYLLLRLVFKLPIEDITSTMLTFGMGASSMALFARVGGGIYTKAADVGADLVGKVEAGIPEDDPRNPAVIADNVGDNVGDVAGMGADLYESYVGSILSACALGVIAFNKIEAVDRVNAVVIPMVLAAVGVLASIIGSLLVKTGESTDQSTLLKALRRGTNTSAIIIAVVAFPLVWFILGKDFILFCDPGRSAGRRADRILYGIFHVRYVQTDAEACEQIRDGISDDHHRRTEPWNALYGSADHYHRDLCYGGIRPVRRVHRVNKRTLRDCPGGSRHAVYSRYHTGDRRVRTDRG